MFNIINFAESKTKNGCNLKLSAYVDDETIEGAHWENIYIYIPYINKAHADAKKPVICKTDEDGNLYIFVPKERRYVPKEAQKQPPKKEEKDAFGDCPF